MKIEVKKMKVPIITITICPMLGGRSSTVRRIDKIPVMIAIAI